MAVKQRREEGLRRRIEQMSEDELQIPEPNLKWMGKSHQWNTRVLPGPKGMTLGGLNVGFYGEIPEHWEDQTRMPRGSMEGRGGIPPIGYSERSKHNVWADNAADLYEEAISRRWIPATDVPWDTLEPLAEDVEIAMCQLCTELIQHANVEIETIAQWQEDLSYGYHEVKQFLATETFDATRHFEVFRKRALSNGGGLGLESRGYVNRMVLESRGGWTETVAQLHLLRGLFTLTLYRHGLKFAHSAAEREIFSRCIQDKSRHLAYALDHLRYAINQQEDQGLILEQVLAIGEGVFVRELADPVLREALAILFAGGIKGAARKGMRQVDRLLGDYVREYAAICTWLGLGRGQALVPGLAQYADK